jgi:NRPS condensation-like uncharacterized protein
MPLQVPASLPVEFTERVVYTMVDSGFMRPQLGAAIEFEGHLDAARMTRAVRLLADSEPVLGCRFVAAAVPPLWERVEDLDEFTLTEIREASDFATDASAFVAEPFDPVTGPQLRAAVLRGSSRDGLVLAISHLAVDGDALKQALYLLGSIYQKLEREPDWRPPVNQGARNTEPIIHETKIVDRFKALRPDELFPATEWGVQGVSRQGSPLYVWRNVEPTIFRKLVQFGRVHDATVNDMLLAAYYRSLYAALKPKAHAQTPVQLSCDLRSLIPKDTRIALANISATWTVSLAIDLGEPFAETLECVVEQTTEWKRSGAMAQKAVGVGLADRLSRNKGLEALRKQIDAAAGKVGHGTGYPTLTNIGVIDSNRLDFGARPHVTSAYLFGPIASPSGFVLTASTFRDCLRLSAGIDRKATDIKLAQSIVGGTVRELEEAVA